MKKKLMYIAVVLALGGGLFLFTNSSTKTCMPNPAAAVLHTNYGDITIELLTAEAPKTVANFTKLACENYFDGTLFHRVIKNFMIQGGDPLTKQYPKDWSVHGTGGPGYKFEDEPNAVKLVRGVVAMANSGPNTNGSQFFIITAPSTDWLQGKHTAFGRVTAGQEVVTKIENVATNGDSSGNHPLEDVKIESVDLK
jgi:cyclophilin family peptidyl-prolyl cis-trans isomerase